jgi:TRAP-type C4-dicarboxylate transport system substrate-binding protein
MDVTMKQYKRLAAAFGLAAIATASAWQSEARAVEKLIYATFFSEVYAGSKADIWLMEEIEKRSGGEIKFERYWANSLLKGPDLFPGLKTGAADLVNTPPQIYNVKEFPLAAVMMPFLTTRGDATMYAWRDLYKNNAAFRNEFESRGAKVLYAFAWAENTVWSKRPISKLEDLKGLKLRAVPPLAEPMRRLGATPVALGWAEGIEGLNRGVVEAIGSTPFDSAVHGNMQDVAKHGNDFGGTGIYAVTTVAMSMDRYNKLSEKHRKIIDEVAAEAPAMASKILDQSVDSAVDKLCAMKEKLTITKLSPEDTKKVQEIAGVGLQTDWIARVKAETKVDGRALLDEFIGYLRKYEQQSKYVPGFDRYEKKCGKS